MPTRKGTSVNTAAKSSAKAPSYTPGESKRVTTRTVREMKSRGEKLTMITAYDYTFARLFDEAGADLLLVGDSLSNVIQGNETTIPVTLDEMIYHAKLVVRGALRGGDGRAMVICDMP